MARFGSTASIFGLNFSGSFTPTATITPSVNSVTEGGSVTFTIASNLISKQISYRVSHNGTSNTDFNPSSSVTGTVTTTGTGSGTITLTTVNDLIFASGSKSFTVILSFDTKDIATSSSVTITDAATVTFGTKPGTISEGSSGTFNVTTSNLSNTTLYWRISYTVNVDAADFNASSGFFSITSGAGSFIVTPTADATTEGTQTFQVIISSTAGGPELANSGTIVINDTSQNPTYAFGTVPTSINEGSTGTFNVNTTNVTNGTTLYWTLVLTGNMTASDFSAATGSFTINSNTGSFTVSPLADATTEGAETFQVEIRTGSIGGTIVATSTSVTTGVTVNDTSLTPQIAGTGTLNYLAFVDQDYITISPTGPDAGSYNYSISASPAVTYDFTGYNGTDFADKLTSTTGSLAQNTTGKIWLQSSHVATTITVTFTRTGYTSRVITVSVPARTAITYSITANTSSVNEGGSVTFTVQSSVALSSILPPSTTYPVPFGFYGVYGISSADLSSGDLGAPGVLHFSSAGTATKSYTLANDLTTEGAETMRLDFWKVQKTSDMSYAFLTTGPTVTVNDTSLTPLLTLTVNFTTVTYQQGTAIPNNPSFNRPVVPSGGTGSYSYSITNLATLNGVGISFDSATGILSGTPNAGLNSTSCTITVTSGSQTATQAITIFVSAVGEFTSFGSVNDVTQSWTVPAGVTSISIICIGGGGGAGAYGLQYNTSGTLLRRHGGGGGGGGALSYRNTYTVTSGTILTVTAGKYGIGGGSSRSGGGTVVPDVLGPSGTAGGTSQVLLGATTLVAAGGGGGGTRSNFVINTTVAGGSAGARSAITGTAGGNGGAGNTGIGAASTATGITGGDGGGGGAGGYSGNGGIGGSGNQSTTTQNSGGAGAGGGGGGGAGGRGGAPATGIRTTGGAGGGGGVASLGTGTNGTAGTGTTPDGGGGSGGQAASSSVGGNYGGGGAQGRDGGRGYVRIIWPGSTRTFPSAAT